MTDESNFVLWREKQVALPRGVRLIRTFDIPSLQRSRSTTSAYCDTQLLEVMFKLCLLTFG